MMSLDVSINAVIVFLCCALPEWFECLYMKSCFFSVLYQSDLLYSNKVEAANLLNSEDRNCVETVLKYIEDADLRRWSLPEIKAFRIGLDEWRSKFNCIINPNLFEQVWCSEIDSFLLLSVWLCLLGWKQTSITFLIIVELLRCSSSPPSSFPLWTFDIVLSFYFNAEVFCLYCSYWRSVLLIWLPGEICIFLLARSLQASYWIRHLKFAWAEDSMGSAW